MLVTMSDSPASASAAPSAVRRTAQAVDEAELLARAVSGDSAAFDRLVTVHQQQIARLVSRLLGWRSDVDDVVQDVFVDALRSLSRFNGRSSVLTWLTRLHFGRWRNAPVLKALWAIIGLVPLMMLVTGVIMWWNRVLRKRPNVSEATEVSV